MGAHVRLFVIPWTVVRQAALSVGFPKKAYWSGCHFLLQGSSRPREEELGCVLWIKGKREVVKHTPLGVSVSPGPVQSLSHVGLFMTPWTAAHQASLSITNSRSILKLMSIESVMPSNHLILCRPLLLLLQSFPASGSLPMSLFFVIRWPKHSTRVDNPHTGSACGNSHGRKRRCDCP